MKNRLKFIVFFSTAILFLFLQVDTSEVSAKSDKKANASEQVITFQNKTIEKKVRESLNKEKGNLTIKDAKGIKQLYLNNLDLKDISDLKWFTSLETLYLDNNNIEDISVLSNLSRLSELFLEANNITDISPIKACKDLISLHLGYNQIEDISVLKYLTKLIRLQIQGNLFEDYSSILDLKSLNTLLIYSINITDYTELKQLSKQLEYKDFDYDKDSAVAKKVTEVIKEIIKPGMSDFEKEIAVHDYIVLHTAYDYENYLNKTIPDESYTPYGLLMKGTGVCSGYADTFKLFMDKLGIECSVVSGKANNNEGWGGHAWNIVKIEGEYYQVDVTWDDPVPDMPGLIRYDYMNISDSQMKWNHMWQENMYPECTSVKRNYNYYNICRTANISPDNPSYITGTISLPKNNFAHNGGLKIRLDLDGSISDQSKYDYSPKYVLTIPQGKSSIDYSIPVPDLSYSYVMFCDPSENYQYEYGYYSGDGLNKDFFKNVKITKSSHTNIDITLPRKSNVPNDAIVRVSLPDESVAPKGGMKVAISLGTKDSESQFEAIIPEGKNYVDAPFSVKQTDETQYFLYYTLVNLNDDYLPKGFLNAEGMTSNISKAGSVQVYNGSMFHLELIKGKGSIMINGKLSLPEGDVAPKGGLNTTIVAYADAGTTDYILDNFRFEKKVVIPQGKNSVEYSMEVANVKTGYSVSYVLDNAIDGYIESGYYSETGNQNSIRPETMVEASNCSAVNMVISKGYLVSGRISLPQGEIALVGGINVTIMALSLNNTYDNFEDDVSNQAQVVIPEGENSAEYSMILTPAKSEYRIYYQVNELLYNEADSKYYRNGFNTKSGIKIMKINGSTSDVNLTIVRVNWITGRISLPSAMAAPKDGIQVIITAYQENGTSNNTYDDFAASEIFTIPVGKNMIEYILPMPESDSRYCVAYSIISSSSGCLTSGYYGINGVIVEKRDQAYMFEPQNSREIDLNIAED